MIKISIADDHQSVVDGVYHSLVQEENISILACCTDGASLLKAVKKQQPNFVITGIKMSKVDGFEVTKLIKQEFPSIKVIVFTMFNQKQMIKEMTNLGASAYILKSAPLDSIYKVISKLLREESVFSLTNQETLIIKKEVLSKSELEILHLIGLGKTSKEIALFRSCSSNTIDSHRKNMMRKLSLKGKGELLRYAIEKKYHY